MWYMDCGISAKEKNNDVHYFVKWSPLAKADRWEIHAKVPALAGIFELYWMDEKKRLRLFIVGRTHFGGLRSEIRELTDPELCNNNEKRKKILEEKEIWYRFAPTDSSKVMADVIWHFNSTYFPDNTTEEHSGRYENIFMTESEPDKLIWVP